MSEMPPANTTASEPARRGPFALLKSARGEAERVVWPYGFGRPALRERLMRGTRMSQMDIYQQGGDLVISVELPGIRKEDISVALQQGDLIIQGETRTEEEREKSYYWRERRDRSFYRRVRLPFEVNPEMIQAKYADGVLEVRIPNPGAQAPETRPIAVL